MQTVNSCSPCSVSSLTSTSVRVAWPKRGWFWVHARYYTLNCTSTPGCGTTRVPHGTYSTDVTGLTAGTYYQFRVTNDRARVPHRRPVYRTCAGTTGLYQLFYQQAHATCARSKAQVLLTIDADSYRIPSHDKT